MANRFHLADLFETAAAQIPDRIAIKSDAGHLSYGELNARAERLAAGLWARGVRRGESVGLYLMNGPEYLEGLLAAFKIGAVPFNVNYRYRAAELRYLFANAEAVAVIHGAEFAPVIEEIRGDLPGLRLTISVADGIDQVSGTSYDALLAAVPGGPYERHEDDILLLYTGGTTGMPKGVMWPHRAFFFACLNGAGYYHPDGPCQTPADIAARASGGYPLTLFPTAPLMHGAAIWSALGALLSGLTLVLDPVRRFDPEAIWDRVEREGASMVQIVGDAMAIPLRDALRAHPGRWKLDHVVNFGSGGATFSAAIKDEIKSFLPNASITDGMGSSETGVSGMAQPSADGMMRLPVSDVQTIVVDGRLGRPGETGFVARSGNIPVGYFGDPVKSAETFQRIGERLWAVSGDSARIDDDGLMTVFGRGSTCVTSGGEKVFPEEVEEALRTHPAVYDAVVAGQPDARWGERVIAIVSARDATQKPGLDDLKTHLADKLAGYKLPKAVVWVDAVPRSPAGKQDYRWAKEMAAAAL
jgi:3-oxocholest-4-en-26-oate---CoA ligase